MPLHISRHLTVGAVYEYNNETWVWRMSINAVRLIHIPLSPPTDWLSLAIPRRLCSHHPYPSSLPHQMFSFSLSPLSWFLFPRIFHQSSSCFSYLCVIILLAFKKKKKICVSDFIYLSSHLPPTHPDFLCPVLFLMPPPVSSCNCKLL